MDLRLAQLQKLPRVKTCTWCGLTKGKYAPHRTSEISFTPARARGALPWPFSPSHRAGRLCPSKGGSSPLSASKLWFMPGSWPLFRLLGELRVSQACNCHNRESVGLGTALDVTSPDFGFSALRDTPTAEIDFRHRACDKHAHTLTSASKSVFSTSVIAFFSAQLFFHSADCRATAGCLRCYRAKSTPSGLYVRSLGGKSATGLRSLRQRLQITDLQG